MKFAPIVPISCLPLIKDFNYHLALAHVAIESTEYCKFYSSLKSPAYVILDNGAFELGEPLSADRLLEMAEYVGADEVVLPDVLGDVNATLKKTVEAYSILQAHSPNLQLMGVLQGKNVEEFDECLLAYSDLYIDVIGISSYILLTQSEQSSELRTWIRESLAVANKSIHILGMGVSVERMREIVTTTGLRIRGVDSSAPAKAALADSLFRAAHDWSNSPKLDFKAEPNPAQVELLKLNLRAARKAVEQ